MAGKDKKPTSRKDSPSGAAKVTRITATDDKKTAKTKSISKAQKPSKTLAAKSKTSTGPLGRLAAPFRAAGRYFKGAWYELRQVRWPNRRATWSLTAAVMIFTAFFAVLILLLDALFKYLFQLILG
jgi:preprotein translocase SecE subunit